MMVVMAAMMTMVTLVGFVAVGFVVDDVRALFASAVVFVGALCVVVT